MAKSKGKPSQTEGGGDKSVHYRCSFNGIAKIAPEIRDRIKQPQLDLLRSTSFWPFYILFQSGVMSDVVNDKMVGFIESILSCYVDDDKKFKIGSETLTMTAKDIAIIFGMKLEGKTPEVYPKIKINQQTDDFVMKYTTLGNNRLKWNKTDIKSAIIATAGDDSKAFDFVKLIILYMCMTIFFVNGAGDVGSSLYENIKDLETINSISWPHLIYDYVMKSLSKNSKSRLKVTGCVLSYVYWICKHTNVVSRRHGYAEQFPRIGSWSLPNILNEFQEDIASLPSDAVCKSYILPLTSEEQSLIGGDIEEKEYVISSDEDENESDTEEVRRLKRKINSRDTIIRQQAKKLEVMDENSQS